MQMLRQKGRTAQHMEKTAKSLSSVLSVLSGSFLSIRSFRRTSARLTAHCRSHEKIIFFANAY